MYIVLIQRGSVPNISKVNSGFCFKYPPQTISIEQLESFNFRSTVKLHKRGPLLQTAGDPFPLLLGQPSSALLSTAQAGGPLSVKIGWAAPKLLCWEDD